MNPNAQALVELLKSRNERIVLAESCTCGALAAAIGLVPGASEVLCGSFVVYRLASKAKWLDLTPESIEKYTAESEWAAKAIALHAIGKTPEAHWGFGVVGHFGPNAPETKDGVIWYALQRSGYATENRRMTLASKSRQDRQYETVDRLLEFLVDHLSFSQTKLKFDLPPGATQ